MPELPEVETIRRRLAPVLVGRTIRRAVVSRSDIVGFPSARQLAQRVAGSRIAGLNRRGKYLILELDQGRELIFHFRLSGRLELTAGKEATRSKDGGSKSGIRIPQYRTRPRFERVRFELSEAGRLSFIEPRVLGKVYLVDRDKRPRCLLGMTRMGYEPIERAFTPQYLAKQFAGRRTAVKNLLLDQSVCSGVGNIYSDEALHRAGIRPVRLASELSRDEVGRLSRALRVVIQNGIKWCGTTLEDDAYRLPDRGRGSFQKRLKVVEREGQRCLRPGCVGTVKTYRFGARTSRYCPVCQR